MSFESENVMFLLSLLVQLIGVGGVFAARIHASRRGDRQFDVLALICFAVVGIVSCVFMMHACAGGWLAFATTMPLMAVGATLDLKKPQKTAAF